MATPKPRQAGRAILRDARGRVLLIRFVLPNMTFWATPGGGVEPGETVLAAARRELHEELGIEVPLEGPVHQAVGIFEFEGILIENADTFYAGRYDGDPRLTGATANESAALQEVRWWTVEELASTDEDVFPRDLVSVLRRLG
ncbi:MAG TPA: NUDIX domain-containing protein [Rhizomicrobium sp.]|nr:NUDIX domain-containing protein [Rhizomicrobium sp.]